MSVLVSSLIAGAKLVSDNKANAALDDTTDWTLMINWGVESLWKFVNSVSQNMFFATYNPAALTGGVASSSIDMANATRYRGFYGLDLNPDTSQRRTVPRRNFAERNAIPIAWWEPAPLAQDRAYDIRGRTIFITPYEIAAGTYRVYFKQGPYLFTGPADATPLDWQLEPHREYIEIMGGRHALGIEESETGPKSERLAEIKQEIEEELAQDDGAGWNIGDTEDM